MLKRTIIASLILSILILSTPALANGKPVISTTRLVDGMSGIYYGNRIVANGEKPLLFALVTGQGARDSFPRGLKLSESGILSGTTNKPGDYSFTVRVTNPSGSTYMNYNLRIKPYDENSLSGGGLDEAVIGSGEDSLSGIANAINGGRLTMQGDSLFFIDFKGYLYQLDDPFEGKAKKLFTAVKYSNIDSLPETLYYYQHYLNNKTTEKLKTPSYINRIAADPIFGKGRNTLISLRLDACKSLSVTNEQVLFVAYDDVMTRGPLDGSRGFSFQIYHNGQEVKASQVFPYNGKAYFKELTNSKLYSAYLDGELAQLLITEPIGCYTIAKMAGEDRLVYTDSNKQLYSAKLDGSDIKRLDGHFATSLNSNENAVFYADYKNKKHLSMISLDEPDEVTVLTDFAVDEIYASDKYAAVKMKGKNELYIISLLTPQAGAKRIKY